MVPGVTYGENFNSYVRIAYTMKTDVLKQAVDRIERFMNGLMK